MTDNGKRARVVVHCTGCDETFETGAGMLGALCGKGTVRRATEAEVAEWSREPVCTCDQWPMPFACEVH